VRSGQSPYERLHAEDRAHEVRIFWSELAIAAGLAFLTVAYFIVA
jgi:hypothetical protein